jgi:hypothetical protein
MTVPARDLSLYDGRTFLGRVSVEADGQAHAFNTCGEPLGPFQTEGETFAAVSAAKLEVERRS